MLTDFLLTVPKVYLSCGYTDMRKSINGLSSIVEQQFHLDPFQPAAFLFCGRRADRMKILLWDTDGFILLYKRLENKSRFQWLRSEKEVRELDPRQVRWLLECIDIDQPKASQQFMPKSVL